MLCQLDDLFSNTFGSRPVALTLKLQDASAGVCNPQTQHDRLFSAGAIAYSGPFVPSYRSALFADWSAKLDALGVPHSPHASLTKTLADPVQVTPIHNSTCKIVGCVFGTDMSSPAACCVCVL